MASWDSMEVMYFVISLLKDFLVSLLVVWQRQHDDTQAVFTNVKLFLRLSMKHDADGQNRDRLNRVVKLQRKISDALLPSLLDIYNQCFICRVSSIVNEPSHPSLPSHPSHSLFFLMHSGRRDRSICSQTTKLLNSCPRVY